MYLAINHDGVNYVSHVVLSARFKLTRLIAQLYRLIVVAAADGAVRVIQ